MIYVNHLCSSNPTQNIQHKYKEYTTDVGFYEAKPTTGKILGLPSQEALRKKEYIKTYKKLINQTHIPVGSFVFALCYSIFLQSSSWSGTALT